MQKQQGLSRLETIPSDILHHIAFLAALHSCSCSNLNTNANALAQCDCTQAPTALSCLLQTSSAIYRQISLTAMPALYADLFFAMFDTQALARRYSAGISQFQVGLTSSALAAEFVSRCCLLRRVRRGDMSPNGLMQDLWTALWMLLESDGTNEVHLAVLGFSRFIVNVAHSHLDPCLHPHLRNPSVGDGRHILSRSHSHSIPSLNAIIIWLLCLSIHKGEWRAIIIRRLLLDCYMKAFLTSHFVVDVILDMPKNDRDALVCCIFPFMFGEDKVCAFILDQQIIASWRSYYYFFGMCEYQ